MTTIHRDTIGMVRAHPGVYAPQDDSRLLCEVMPVAASPLGARALDLCTGTGVLALQAACLGAREVLAYDLDARAVACALDNAERIGVEVDARQGTLIDALAEAPFDLVVSNPPYVPSPTAPEGRGVHRAWDAGADGRIVLDPLCDNAFDLLTPGGTMLIVQSEFAGVDRTIERLMRSGTTVDVVARRRIAFGPVMHARAEWLEATGALQPGRRSEELVVVRARRA
ncbi:MULTISPECIES: methyltransferase [unclassified Rhodococcus (in: high G+C Gram-positive bacteria)]|uniref:methyltransferase n=1 Tax=unclassified Rhodococcus (in: high G+C Gram-positive bacteria) TaxID=192944 RepID=UPI0027DF4E82|nr:MULTISPECIES: methyltransferase [unclassified Rhodococcus (in: high G+C Gram-positive bacteria)]